MRLFAFTLAVFLSLVSAHSFGFANWNVDRAVSYSKLSLACMDQSYPYKSDHVVSSIIDVKAQSTFHPAFYGCFDWHSATHGHWALLKLIDTFPDLPNRAEIEKRLDAHFQKKIIEVEAATFARDDQKRFERAYGYAWFLRLMIEVRASHNSHQEAWLEALEPLEKVIRSRFLDYLKVFDYPIRRGVHENSAFALAQAYDYAESRNDEEFLAVIKATARKFYQYDTSCPIAYEPEGDDFLSPCLAEADLMRRVLPKKEFLSWFKSFWPQTKGERTFFQPVIPTNINDAKAVHLVGLDFYKAWTMESIGNVLPKSNHLKDIFLDSSKNFAQTGDDLIGKPGYEGTHWLASYAIFLFTHENH